MTSLRGCVATSCFPLYCVSRLCLGASQIKVTCGSCRDPEAFSSKVGTSQDWDDGLVVQWLRQLSMQT